MRILGVDPGLRITGYALLEDMKLVEWGRISMSGDWKESLLRITETLQKKLKEFRPDEIAMESSFTGINPSSSIKIAHLRGAIIYMAMKNGLRVFDYSPSRVKKSITGRGNASKREVRTFIGRIFGEVEGFDEADAVAVAFTHYLARQHDREIEG